MCSPTGHVLKNHSASAVLPTISRKDPGEQQHRGNGELRPVHGSSVREFEQFIGVPKILGSTTGHRFAAGRKACG